MTVYDNRTVGALHVHHLPGIAGHTECYPGGVTEPFVTICVLHVVSDGPLQPKLTPTVGAQQGTAGAKSWLSGTPHRASLK